jgi:(1->4)-alpha-D-glucan 1-alpha-D-glucosylmutase
MNERRATYRVQLHRGFTFDNAAAIADYLSDLGISHLYCSPYLQAAPGSMHGYDVVDYRRLNEELGGAPGHARMHTALRQHGLQQILDIVPNHMAIVTPQNPWWWDVLENGPSSNYAAYFDVDWDTPEQRLRNSVLIPVLGDQYGFVLDRGEIRVERQRASLIVRYNDNRFPVAPRSLDTVLAAAARRCGSEDLAYLADAFGGLPLATATDHKSVTRRHRDKGVLQSYLERLIDTQAEVAAAIDTIVAELNEDRGALHDLLERQHYRLAYWRAASRDLGYRRFFDINTLAGLRMEDRRVFEETHFLILRWLQEGVLDGVRIDHIDGLRAPEQYLARVAQKAPAAWLLVEKILEPGEQLRDSWPIAGTTGYDFISRAGELFVDPSGEEPLTEIFAKFTGEPADYKAIALQKKQFVLSEVLGSDLNRLAALFLAISENHPHHRDCTRHDVHEVLRLVAAHFPVYRTYVSPDACAPGDIRYIGEAVQAAKASSGRLDARLFDFIRDILLLRVHGELETELAMRFQQLTGPVMAKAIEDTTFYCYSRFVALNEVGCDPSRFGITADEFHRENTSAQRQWPSALLATSTHDTKRSEDVRARLSLLSEIPDQWAKAVNRWSEINRPYWGDAHRDANAEYLLYQTLVGAWPIDRNRAGNYMLKAAREAKLHTSWTQPNEPYEQGLNAFVDGIFGNREFLDDLAAFVGPLIWPGQINSLALTLLKLTSPGVPDFYQGCEIWNLTLVDPDNRQPVDYSLRRRLLGELKTANVREVIARAGEGLPKLLVIKKALNLRRRQPQWFGPESSYRPLVPHGAASEYAVAFARSEKAITVVPRLPLKLNGQWRDTSITIPEGRWRNEFTGEAINGGEVRLSSLMAQFPVCLLALAEDL